MVAVRSDAPRHPDASSSTQAQYHPSAPDHHDLDGSRLPVGQDSDRPSELRACEFEREILRGQLQAHRGTPLTWTPQEARRTAEHELRARLERVFQDAAGVELKAVDCNEPPCLVALAAHSDAMMPAQIVERLAEAGIVDGPTGGLTKAVFLGAGEVAVVQVIASDEYTADELLRVEYRLEQLAEDISSLVEE